MSYQISYGQDCVSKKIKHELRLPKPKKETVLRIGLTISVLLLGLTCLIPQARAALWDLLLPGDPEVTSIALERLVETVSEGESIQTALTEFCREIIDHGLQAA